MEFEWDENKRKLVINKHRVDFLYAAQIFEGRVVTRVDDREDYGETRLISIGLVDDECFVVVYSERYGAIRLITAWKGGRHERFYYEKILAAGHQGDEGEG